MSEIIKEEVNGLVDQTKEFANNAVMFVRKCTKPDKKEFLKIAQSCAIGFAVMGVVGYVIKLVFIPINNIILSN